MRMVLCESWLDIFAGVVRVARYHFRDAFKPCFHPVATASGLVVSAAGAHDHKHQKGLMYALRVPDVNFWEEVATTPMEKVGCQRHVGFSTVEEAGDVVGFTQELVWEAADGTLATFAEVRKVTVGLQGEGKDRSVHFTWQTKLEALRDTKLIMSQWARPNPAGRVVSYHGLALRMVRDFACTGGTQLIVDGTPMPMEQGLGRVPREVTFIGTLDPVYPAWPGPRVAITFTQGQANALGLRDTPFAFLSLGPSNLEAKEMRKGDLLQESYAVRLVEL